MVCIYVYLSVWVSLFVSLEAKSQVGRKSPRGSSDADPVIREKSQLHEDKQLHGD